MADPLSLITVSAAIGGLAGKVAEKTWDGAEKWLREKFGSHAAEAQQQARENAAKFVQQLAIQVNILEEKHIVDRDSITTTQTHPQFSTLLQQTILNAAQTGEKQKHDLLARLVANRLACKSETTSALASQLASDAISRSTPQQLELMALCCFLDEIRPKTEVTVPYLREWLDTHLEPFIDFEFREADARHLVAIACASFDPTSSRNLNFLLGMKGGVHCVDGDFDDVSAVEAIQINWDLGLAGVFLTSVGSIVGGLALSQITGRDYGKPTRWD